MAEDSCPGTPPGASTGGPVASLAPMALHRILGIETSCDETAASVVDGGR